MKLLSLIEGTDNIVNNTPDADLGLPSPTKIKKKTKKQPTTDAAENSIIKNLWFYNASDSN